MVQILIALFKNVVHISRSNFTNTRDLSESYFSGVLHVLIFILKNAGPFFETVTVIFFFVSFRFSSKMVANNSVWFGSVSKQK